MAACIGADSTYSDLLDKRKSAHLCNNLNYRNRMAQYAGRASVSLNTHLFFRGRTQEESGYILFVRKNALQILIPKFGLEGTIYLSGKKGAAHKSGIQFVFNEEASLSISQCKVSFVFLPFKMKSNEKYKLYFRITLNTTKILFFVLSIQLSFD